MIFRSIDSRQCLNVLLWYCLHRFLKCGEGNSWCPSLNIDVCTLMSKLEISSIWSFLVHWEHGSWRTELNIQILIQAKLGGNIRNDWYDINRDVTYLCHDLIPYSVPVEHNELSWNKIDPFREEQQLICYQLPHNFDASIYICPYPEWYTQVHICLKHEMWVWQYFPVSLW